MVDIERLRMWDDPGETICQEAADKIERYRAAMSWLAGHEPELVEQAREKYKVE